MSVKMLGLRIVASQLHSLKGPLGAAIRLPLMKALDMSVKMLGLRIVASQLHSLNL